MSSRQKTKRLRRGERLPLAARTWASEAAAQSPLRVWITPHAPRMIRVPQLPPPRYFAVLTSADGSEQTFDWSCCVKCGGNLPAALGLDADYQTLLRLIKGDFIAAVQITPNNFLLDLTSLHAFLCEARDPLFWTPARKERFRQSRAGGEYV